MPDGRPVATKDAPIGGQAARGRDDARRLDLGRRRPQPRGRGRGHLEPIVSWAKRHRVLRLPVIRGVVALGESLKIGFKALAISANAQLEEDEEGEKEEIGGWMWGLTIALSMALAVGLFFVIPIGATSLIKDWLGSALLFWLVEGIPDPSSSSATSSRISRLPDLRRVFEYHGAEHKTISCFEAGDELKPERAQIYSRLHPRCGTSFLLIVMVLAISLRADRPA